MKIVVVNYADHTMTQSQKLCSESAYKYGADFVYVGKPENIDTDFKHLNRSIFDGKRGAGCYWIFKPYFIEYVMRDLQDGDILIYADAGIEFVAPVNEIISKMDEDIFFFTNGFPHVEWCKGDVFETITKIKIPTDGQYDHLRSFKQVQASVIFFRVNQKTKDFIKEWLLYCQMPGFIDDSPSKLPNYPTFAEHRHDQAILTCLQIKYGYKLHWYPSTTGHHIRHMTPDDPYPELFNHHRKRNKGYGNGQPEWT